jgi:hypothetical protein
VKPVFSCLLLLGNRPAEAYTTNNIHMNNILHTLPSLTFTPLFKHVLKIYQPCSCSTHRSITSNRSLANTKPSRERHPALQSLSSTSSSGDNDAYIISAMPYHKTGKGSPARWNAKKRHHRARYSRPLRRICLLHWP